MSKPKKKTLLFPQQHLLNNPACLAISCQSLRWNPALMSKWSPLERVEHLIIGRRGDADVVFVHDKPAEEQFVQDGYATKRYEVMYNDFILIGPKSDPAKVGGGKDIQAAFQKIAAAQAPFVSRGDKSGTHAAELRYWKGAGIAVSPSQSWYKETGSGMGPALNTASAMNGYILADRGTWLSFKNRGDLTILVQGDPKLFNQYGVMLVNPAKFSHVKKAEGQAFIDWLVSKNGQDVIASYQIGGEQLFSRMLRNNSTHLDREKPALVGFSFCQITSADFI
jgi:tungstate transport system substrate-binding protein